MSEQKTNPLCQMNLTLKGVTADIEALPEIRRRAFRGVHRLLQYSFNETKARLAEALGYKNAETMRADTEALTDIIVQVQRAFGESKVHGIGYEDDSDTSPQDIPDWLKAERNKWRPFELTCEDKSQVGELNDILTRHDLTRRELAVILASLRIRPEFTLDDFHADKDLSASSDRERLIQALLEFTEQTVKSGGLLESNIQALPGVVAVLAGLLAE